MVLNMLIKLSTYISSAINKSYFNNTWIFSNPQRKLLNPQNLQLISKNGMKQKGKVQKRCPDCYFVWRQGRLYNMCKSKPRHKQMSIVKPEKETWILTFSQTKPRREW